jgi:hypothetical protein
VLADIDKDGMVNVGNKNIDKINTFSAMYENAVALSVLSSTVYTLSVPESSSCAICAGSNDRRRKEKVKKKGENKKKNKKKKTEINDTVIEHS